MKIIVLENNKVQIEGKEGIELLLDTSASLQVSASREEILISDKNGASLSFIPSVFVGYTVNGSFTPYAEESLTNWFLTLSTLFFTSSGSTGGENTEIAPDPPSDTSKLWFRTTDSTLYFFDGVNWVSEKLYSVVFNDQGNTPNNTFFRVGNTTTSDSGVGYNIQFGSAPTESVKIEGLSFNRLPSTAQLGNYWLYSNSQTGTEFANVIVAFPVDNSPRGYISAPAQTVVSSGKYFSLRWNGQATNNNICELYFRKIPKL